MSSVTKRISQITQPRGGYVNPKMLVELFADAKDTDAILLEQENIAATTTGMVVDYMTRFMMSNDKQSSFKISLIGATYATALTRADFNAIAADYLIHINGVDDTSIAYACKLVGFDVWLRNTPAAIHAWVSTNGHPTVQTTPDSTTCNHIRAMIARSLKFWDEYGPITADGFTFEPNGYTNTVNTGDGDYLTTDTLWDFKVSKTKPSSKHTLQLLMYWIMGRESGQKIYDDITKLGLFNPRLNKIYRLNVDDIPAETIKAVKTNVICYQK